MNQKECYNTQGEICPVFYALELQRHASTVGFDWENISGVLDKVREELEELDTAITSNNLVHARDEYGDVIFSLLNLARFLQFNPLECLKKASEKFEARFRLAEQLAHQEGVQLKSCSGRQLDDYWERAKYLMLQ